ncbi:hypothetical protein C8A05DRAFT_47476 [Staphylotrichum tortipilum]|uniref:NmrA-like domain-containing protein n=1 Tax=Staphylotrichum tortipilum TaxID=2831512 RepID=A0AAN6RPX5_9PEZI|nr:hypothetical protein C8A05DRAFT_47476 [Staphylotrichum longicolle]
MVKIAIAGASGNVAQEILDGLVAQKKHEILLLSRKDARAVAWVKANYDDAAQLAEILQGVDTVLSFIVAHSDPGSVAQKNLIDAAVQAGVRRFAPSEWTGSSFDYMPWYAGKLEIREYLKELNKDEKILEYTLFQPGLFMNYLTNPYTSTKHVHPIETPIDFGRRRILMVEGSDGVCINLTTVEDLVSVVVRAVEYEGEWPLVGGIKGDEITIGNLIKLGERVRGGPFSVERLNAGDLRAGVVRSSWLPKADHPSISPEESQVLAASFTAGMLMGISVGALSVSDEWNRLLPDYEFIKAEGFLTEAWSGRPE